MCAAYGVPFISIRDAIWPMMDSPPVASRWPTSHGAHPLWQGHQLAADIVSFAIAHAEFLAASSDEAAPQPMATLRIKGSSPRFQATGGSIDACPEGKYLAGARGVDLRSLPSRPVPPGWQWVSSNGKFGWEFDLDRLKPEPPAEPPGVALFDDDDDKAGQRTRPLAARARGVGHKSVAFELAARRMRENLLSSNGTLALKGTVALKQAVPGIGRGRSRRDRNPPLDEARAPPKAASDTENGVKALLDTGGGRANDEASQNESLPGILSFPLLFNVSARPGAFIHSRQLYDAAQISEFSLVA